MPDSEAPPSSRPSHGWLPGPAAAGTVAITGGAGRLGTRLAELLRSTGHDVLVLDVKPPSVEGVRFVPFDIRATRTPQGLFASVDAVVHLAGLHGPHLLMGGHRREFWAVNVGGTQAVLDAAWSAGIARFVMAGSTSVYGPGSGPGQPCRVLDEQTPAQPVDAYDLTKLAAEAVVRDAHAAGLSAAILRLGRFSFESHLDYHLRKLSTGLDVWDACQALVRILCAPVLPRNLYCVASDLPLAVADRRDLGIDSTAVLLRRYPDIVASARRRGVTLPARVGKSVLADALRHDVGYRPERDLSWVARLWTDPAGPRPTDPHRRPHPVAPADLFPLTR